MATLVGTTYLAGCAIPWVMRKPVAMWILTCLGIIGLAVGVTVAVCHEGYRRAPAAAVYLLALLLCCAPFWCLTIYLRLARRLGECRPPTPAPPRRFSVGHRILAGAYLAAWSAAIFRAVSIYASLPKSPPSCFIATAAARGHRRFVGSRLVAIAGGYGLPVNDQLRRLKCAELALMVSLPRVHRRLRAIYDKIGPIAAALISSPFRADITYLCLKPAEWVSWMLLRTVISDADSLIRRVLKNSPDAALTSSCAGPAPGSAKEAPPCK